MEFLGCLVGLAMLAAMASAVWGCYRWVLGPLDRAAKSRQYPAQFSLADLLSLFVLARIIHKRHVVALAGNGPSR